MEIIFSKEFKKEFKKIKDRAIRLRIIKNIKKLTIIPQSGKPLKHDMRGHRSVKIPPFRIIYRLEKDKIVINCFDHRNSVYK